MKREDWTRLGSLLERLLELPDAEAAAELEHLAGDDDRLRTRLAAALEAARGETPGPLARSAIEAWPELFTASDVPPAPGEGLHSDSILGRWRVTGELGRGGMGTVYAVERADGAYEQSAALKLLRLGLDEPGNRERFLRERQILARLEHPSIARLLDGGVAEDGRPFLVLERVDGEPITAYCDHRRLDIDERLRLVLEVLAGVELAHRSLVVHRDLKPSNILVSTAGEVKLLDFGVAKLLAEEDLELTATRLPAPLTPLYAAPEQILGKDVTTATDVYALGVVLYELLSGARPYRLERATLGELEQRIVAGDTPPPSAAALQEGMEAAGRRASIPQRLARRLRGDLDAIVLRCLATEPERRYATVAALRRDLESHLAGRPVEARPDSLAYRTRKFARRHWLGMTASAAFLLLLVTTLVVLAFALAQTRGRLAEAERAEAIHAFLLDLFSQADPEIARGRELTAREILDAGAERLRTELAEQPRSRAALLLTVGSLYTDLGEYDRAEPLLGEALTLREAAYGASSPEVAAVLFELGGLHYWRDEYDRALPLLERARTIFSTRPDRRAELGSALSNLGATLRTMGRYEEAVELQREALDVERQVHGENSLELADIAEGLALALHSAQRDVEALPFIEEAMRIRRSRLPNDHPKVASALETLGLVLVGLGRYAEAEQPLREALAVRQRVLGDEHPSTIEALNGLGLQLEKTAQIEEALAVRRKALAAGRQVYGDQGPSLAVLLNNLATVCHRSGDAPCAEEAFRRALSIWRRTLGDEHPHVATSLNNHGMALLALGHADEALGELEEALAKRRQLHGEETPAVAQSLRNVGLARLARGDLAAARDALDRAVDLSRRVYPAGHPRLAEALVARARLARVEGRPGGARRDLEEALAIRLAAFGAEHPAIAEVRAELARPP